MRRRLTTLALASTLLGLSATGTPTAPAAATTQAGDGSATGTTAAPDGVLKRGCNTYHWSYALQVPSSEWTLEVSIVDRQGHGIGSFAFIGPSHPTARGVSYRLCRWATVPGRFRIRSKGVWYDGPTEMGRIDIPLTVFRLRRPGG